MRTILSKLKSELKALAQEIRQEKTQSACLMREKSDASSLQNCLRADRYSYRYRHIVYCLLRGRRLEEIESKNRPGNEPDMGQIEAIWGTVTGLSYPELPAWPAEEVADAPLRARA